MPVAPRMAAWQRSMRNIPGPLRGSSVAGMSLLPNQLSGAGIIVEAAWGADLTKAAETWQFYDVTPDVRQADGQKVSITVGRGDESGQAQPGTCSFELDNSTGAYSAFSPLGRLWPNVRRNTPIRVTVNPNDGTTGPSVRFFGYATGFTPNWDSTGNLAIVSVAASGLLRRLNQGKDILRSALYRYVQTLNPSLIYAYWPLEDGKSSTQAASAVAGGFPMTKDTLAGIPLVNFAALDVIPGSAPLPNLTNGTALTGNITGASNTSWSVQLVINFGSVGSADSADRIVLINDSAGGGEQLYINPGAANWRLNYNKPAGGFTTLSTVTFASSVNPYDGLSHRILLNFAQSGGNIAWSFYIDGTLADSNTTVATLGAPINAYLGGFGTTSFPFALGHVMVSSQGLDLLTAMNGQTGETATARMTRLCAEQGIPMFITGSSDATMGAQGRDTFVNLIRECEATDGGVLFDGLSAGLGYVTRSARYSQSTALALDASIGEVNDPFQPVDDDQRNRNLIKVDRKNGSSATYQDSTGTLGTNNIGVYDSSFTVNSLDDSKLYARASWEVHKGTFEGLRYPTVNLNLMAIPTRAGNWIGATLSRRMDVNNASAVVSGHPPGVVDLIIEGYTETFSPFDWTVVANCSPNRPWVVALAGIGRVDTSGSTIAAAAALGATSLSVNVNAGKLWTTTAADFPFDVWVNGIQVTVTNITGVSSPQTFTVTGSTVTKALNPGDVVKLWLPAIVAL